MNSNEKRRPAANLDGVRETLGGSSSVATFTADMAAERAHAALLLMVYSPETGRYRRRPFLSLSAAESAAERARARGCEAHVVLGWFVAGEVV